MKINEVNNSPLLVFPLHNYRRVRRLRRPDPRTIAQHLRRKADNQQRNPMNADKSTSSFIDWIGSDWWNKEDRAINKKARPDLGPKVRWY